MDLDLSKLDPTAYVRTDVTKTTHTTVYPAIDPKRPELSQKGKTVLITGAAGTIGLPVARAFVQASPSHLILVGRTVATLDSAVEELKAQAKAAGADTKVTRVVVDLADTASIEALWKSLADDGVVVHTLVLSASAFSPGFKTILQVGKEHVWGMYEMAVRSVLWFAELFQKQGSPGKHLVWLTTNASHAWSIPATTAVSSYAAIKSSGGQLVQQIAFDTNPEDMQVNIYHPGSVHTEGWAALGVTKDMVPWDEPELGGAYAVWAASPEARFLHGRMTWASWDVEELANPEFKKKFEEDNEFLRYGIDGIYGAHRRKW